MVSRGTPVKRAGSVMRRPYVSSVTSSVSGKGGSNAGESSLDPGGRSSGCAESEEMKPYQPLVARVSAEACTARGMTFALAALGDHIALGQGTDRERAALKPAEAMVEAGISIDVVIEIHVDDDEIVGRLSGRRVHPDSGRVYHVQNNPPKLENTDDVTGEPLVQRDDDHEDTVRKRLQVYHEQTEPLVEFYRQLQKAGAGVNVVKIPGKDDVNVIRKKIESVLEA